MIRIIITDNDDDEQCNRASSSSQQSSCQQNCQIWKTGKLANSTPISLFRWQSRLPVHGIIWPSSWSKRSANESLLSRRSLESPCFCSSDSLLPSRGGTSCWDDQMLYPLLPPRRRHTINFLTELLYALCNDKNFLAWMLYSDSVHWLFYFIIFYSTVCPCSHDTRMFLLLFE